MLFADYKICYSSCLLFHLQGSERMPLKQSVGPRRLCAQHLVTISTVSLLSFAQAGLVPRHSARTCIELRKLGQFLAQVPLQMQIKPISSTAKATPCPRMVFGSQAPTC